MKVFVAIQLLTLNLKHVFGKHINNFSSSENHCILPFIDFIKMVIFE